MSKTIETMKLGDTRRITVIVEPNTYCLDNNPDRTGARFVKIRARCSIEATETFCRPPPAKRAGSPTMYQPSNPDAVLADWRVTAYHHDTLKALPTWWQRIRAFLRREPQPLPRAITIVDRSAT